MADQIRWGILGAANFAATVMGPALHMAKGSRVAALATRDPAKAERFAAFAGDIAVFDSYEAMLAEGAIDAVYVPLPNTLHVEWSVRALEAGLSVLCEKPVGMTAGQIDRLIAARDASGEVAAEAFMIVHHPQWQKTRDLIAEGAIGTLAHVEAAFSYNNPDPANIRNTRGVGGGALRDIGVYILGSTRFATGVEPEEMTARLVMEEDYDTVAEIGAQFPGFTYHGYVSTRMAPRQHITFHGTDGHISLTAPYNAGVYDQAEVVLERGPGRREILRWPGVNQYVLQVEAFCETMRTGAPYPWTLEDARGTQAMIDRALEFAGG